MELQGEEVQMPDVCVRLHPRYFIEEAFCFYYKNFRSCWFVLYLGEIGTTNIRILITRLRFFEIADEEFVLQFTVFKKYQVFFCKRAFINELFLAMQNVNILFKLSLKDYAYVIDFNPNLKIIHC